MYKLRLSRREKKKLLRAKWLIIFGAVCAAAFVVWLAWIRPIQRESQLDSFDACVKAGNPIQQTYPEVCLAKNGKRFTNPKQEQAHEASKDGTDELVPPTNPALLVLDIEEWGVRIPLTTQTFDLTYAYVENGESEYILFGYKRLIRLGVCKGDIGFKLERSYAQHNPPYSVNYPAPIAQVDKAYFYPTYADKQCYDANNAEQAALAKQIAGEKTLIQFTAGLVGHMTALPKQ